MLDKIREVSIVENKLWWMCKELVYICLKTTSSRYFCTRYDNIAVKWANCIQTACWRAKEADRIGCRDEEEQEIYINSITNKIVVKKLCVNQCQPEAHLSTKNSRRGRSFLNYTIVKQIGEGAFANVFLIKHKQTQEYFAAKVLDKK